jgi:type IV pilus assembly protein PilA
VLTTKLTRLGRDDRGFTLIELMVVVLIIAILIAIAIPTFLGAQNRARDRSAQSDLRNAVTAARTVSTDHAGLFLNEAGNPIAQGDMPDVEPAINFSDTTADTDLMLINTEPTGVRVTFVKQSASDTFFGVSVTKDGKVTYCKGTAQTDCDDGATDSAYTTKW